MTSPIRFPFPRAAFVRAALVAGACLSATSPRPAPAAAEEERIPDAASGLVAVDSLLRRRLEDRIDREAALEDIEETIAIVERLMLSEEGLSDRRRGDFEKQRDAAEREIEAMNRAVSAAHDGLDDARRSIELGAPLLLNASSEGPGSRRAFALALVHAGRRREAEEGIERIFEIEERKGEKVAALEALMRRVSLFSEFANLSKVEMRERHGELKREAASIRAAIEEDATAARELNARRTALASLAEAPDSDKSREILLALAALGQAMDESERATPAAASISFEMGGGPGEAAEVGYDSGGRVAAFGGETPPDPELGPPPGSDAPRERKVFADPPSERLHALAEGTVAFCAPFAGYETLLILDHGGGWLTVYANLTESALREGETVKAGQAVGTRAASDRRGDPLWIEARQGDRVVPIATMPGAGLDWEKRLFGK